MNKKLKYFCEYSNLPQDFTNEIISQYSNILKDSPALDTLNNRTKELGNPLDESKINPQKWEVECPFYKKYSCINAIAGLLALPKMIEHHSKKGIPEEITKDTANDLAIKMQEFYQINHKIGFDNIFWYNRLLSNKIHSLGRLQFEISKLNFPILKDKNKILCSYKDPLNIKDFPNATFLIKKGEDILNLHIPSKGKLDKNDCLKSMKDAKEFYKKHFPEIKAKMFFSLSWLFNDHLKLYLSPTANIIKFQELFTVFPFIEKWESDIILRTFNTKSNDWKKLIPTNSLQRAVIEHLKNGKSWDYYGMIREV